MGTTIRVTRLRTGYRDRLRRYRVLVDGLTIGRLRRGESVEVPVSAGRHTVRVKIDWTGSPTEVVDVAEGTTESFECEPSGLARDGMWDLQEQGRYVTLRRLGAEGG